MGEVKVGNLLEINRKGLAQRVEFKQRSKHDQESARSRVEGRNIPGGGSEVRQSSDCWKN